MKWGARIQFFREFLRALKLVWPIFSGLLALEAGLALWVSLLEGWPWREGLYFGAITALTIGYGDVVPTMPLSRLISIVMGLLGFMFTGILVALTLRALDRTFREDAP